MSDFKGESQVWWQIEGMQYLVISRLPALLSGNHRNGSFLSLLVQLLQILIKSETYYIEKSYRNWEARLQILAYRCISLTCDGVYAMRTLLTTKHGECLVKTTVNKFWLKIFYTRFECSRELNRCKEQSTGMFFLSLQSAKYGYMPLPQCIDRAAYEIIQPTFEDQVKALAEKWYFLDENNIPPKYFLKWAILIM